MGGLDLFGKVEVLWDDHQIPFILASDDRDAAYALGLVHAHLRLAQMEMLRLVSQGRLSEWIGPFGREVDRAIRTLDLDRAVPAMLRDLPAPTRLWLERFTAGIEGGT